MTPEGEFSDQYLAFLQQFELLQAIGAVLVTSATNYGLDPSDDLVPAALGAQIPALIVVGSAEYDNTISPYSSRSRQGGIVSLYGYGGISWCAGNDADDEYFSANGTSSAAAQVTGLATEKLKDIPEGTNVADIPGLVKRKLQEDGIIFRDIVKAWLPDQQIAPLASTGVGIPCDETNVPPNPLFPLAPTGEDLFTTIPLLAPISFGDQTTVDLVVVDDFVCYLRIRV